MALKLVHGKGVKKKGQTERIALGWFKNPVYSQTEKLMAATKFFDYLGIKHYKKAKKEKIFHPFSFGLLASKFCYIP